MHSFRAVFLHHPPAEKRRECDCYQASMLASSLDGSGPASDRVCVEGMGPRCRVVSGISETSGSGKRDLFQRDDLIAFGQFCDMKKSFINNIIEELHEKVASWRTYAEQAGVSEHMAGSIEKTMRTGLNV